MESSEVLTLCVEKMQNMLTKIWKRNDKSIFYGQIHTPWIYLQLTINVWPSHSLMNVILLCADPVRGNKIKRNNFLITWPCKTNCYTDCYACTSTSRLMYCKAAQPEGLEAEHLKYEGKSVLIWLVRVLNAAVELGAEPNGMKSDIFGPVYKGGGKDPLKFDNYRVSCSHHCLPNITAVVLPHQNQTAQRKYVSCSDAILAN